MTCARHDIADLIGPYADNDLPTEARRRVEDHLLTCPACAFEAQSLQIVRVRLRGEAGETLASDSFRARVLSALHADNPHLTATDAPDDAPAQFRLPIGF